MRARLTLLALCLFGCHSTPEVRKDLVGTVDVLVQLERTPCFGACPVYAVTVLTDGTIRYTGERHVKITELVEVNEPAVVEKLKTRFESSEFSKWGDFQRTPVSDMPTVVLTYKGHTVRHYLGDDKAPEALTKLEDEVDAIIGTDRWVKGVGGAIQ
jgi:hypothetical protein